MYPPATQLRVLQAVATLERLQCLHAAREAGGGGAAGLALALKLRKPVQACRRVSVEHLLAATTLYASPYVPCA